jgi:hypothetical protein
LPRPEAFASCMRLCDQYGIGALFSHPIEVTGRRPGKVRNCAPRRSSRAFCATPIAATKGARCSARSTTGSPRASTPPT